VKNTLIVGIVDRQVKYLSPTHEGKMHDKRMCDEDGTCCPPGYEVYRDLGYQGLEMKGVEVHQPMKKPKGGELTDEQKDRNRAMASVRVTVEQVISGVKRCRILKDVYRNYKDGFDDLVIDIACGLHNFRSYNRLHTY
jgi:hypothetical protein